MIIPGTKQVSVSENTTRLEKLVCPWLMRGHSLQISMIYDDAETRQWARDVYERLEKVAGTNGVRATWWKMSDLSAPGVLAGAVSTAMRANVIVVSTLASEGLSLPFYVWAETWLPHRLPGPGALVALLGASEQPVFGAGRVKEYLRAVACEGRMDFVVEERCPFPIAESFNPPV